jgi:hypothetical protein
MLDNFNLFVQKKVSEVLNSRINRKRLAAFVGYVDQRFSVGEEFTGVY